MEEVIEPDGDYMGVIKGSGGNQIDGEDGCQDQKEEVGEEEGAHVFFYLTLTLSCRRGNTLLHKRRRWGWLRKCLF